MQVWKLRPAVLTSKASFFYLFCLQLLFAGLLNACITPFFQTNDDATMMLQLSGTLILNKPTANILFSNILVALPLKQLYALFPAVQWYPLYFLTLLSLSFTTISYVLFHLFEKKTAIYCVLAVEMSFGLFFFTQWQFTLLSGINFIAGFCALYLYWVHCLKSGLPRTMFIVLLGATHLIISSLVRFPMFISCLAAVAPLIVYNTFSKRIYWPAILILLIAVICFGLDRLSVNYYNAHYQNYYSYNNARGVAGEFRDISCLSDSQRSGIYKQLNWSEDDVLALNYFFFISDNKFTYEKLKKFNELSTNCYNAGKIKEIVRDHAWIIKTHFFYFLPFLIVVIPVFGLRRRKYTWWCIFMFAWSYILITAMALVLKYPDVRVQYPLLILSLVCILSLMADVKDSIYQGSLKLTFILLMLNGCCIFYALYKQSSFNAAKAKYYLSFLNNNSRLMPIISIGQADDLQNITPYCPLSQLKAFKVIRTGCFLQAVQEKEYLNSLGVKNIEDAMFVNKYPVVISRYNAEIYKRLIDHFANVEYGKNIQFDTLLLDMKAVMLNVK